MRTTLGEEATTQLYRLLAPFRDEIQARIHKRLSGWRGKIEKIVYNAFMPLVGNVETDHESCHLTFERGGSVTLLEGSSSNPDVTVQCSHELLEDLITIRDPARFDAAEAKGEITIKAHTRKGRRALSYIRREFRGR